MGSIRTNSKVYGPPFQVLLSRDEFETLSLLLSDYESSDISVDLFAAGLMNLIADAEKVR